MIESAERRVDIQALRGLAIALVLAYHSRLVPALNSGFLGVDIFFVISGFLITGIVSRQIAAGRFSFSGFYFRRARRILPAAYLTLFAVAVASPFILDSQAIAEFQKQLRGSVFFYANIALWRQSGYFDTEAVQKPLLHMWSLAIEEQYYLLMPAALVILPRRSWKAALLAAFALSLGLCLVCAQRFPSATFYLLPTRGWELAIGSLGALIGTHERAMRIARRLFWPGVLALLVVPWLKSIGPHPGVSALLVCLGTLAVILAARKDWDSTPPMRAMEGMGEISYPLYLVHWPLLTFANIAYLGAAPAPARAALVVASIIIAFLIYRFVETPIRQNWQRPGSRSVAATVAASLVLALLPLALHASQVPFDRKPNVGFSKDCNRGDAYQTAACRTGAMPRMLVWGDSYAMHLMQGVAASSSAPVAQATRSACGPLLGLSPINDTNFGSRSAHECLAFNEAVLATLTSDRTVEVVVLASPYSQYLGEEIFGHTFRVMRVRGGHDEVLEPSEDVLVEAFRATVRRLRGAGKRVVVVQPPPSAGFDVGACLERRMNGRLVLGDPSGACDIPVADYHIERARVRAFLARATKEADVPIVGFDELLCDASRCVSTLDGVPLYRDKGHLSKLGSAQVGRRMGLGERLATLAR